MPPPVYKWFVFFDPPAILILGHSLAACLISVARVLRVPIQACAWVNLSAVAMHVNALLGAVVMSLA